MNLVEHFDTVIVDFEVKPKREGIFYKGTPGWWGRKREIPFNADP